MRQYLSMKKLLSIFTILLLAIVAKADIYNSQLPKREVRAVWLTTIGGIDWPHCYAHGAESQERQKQELRDILDRLQKAGINMVMLQTRVRGTVIYPSNIEPWDGCLSGVPGKNPGYDALSFAIDECHKRGMELHAWVVTIPVGKWNKLGCKQLLRKHGAMIKHIGEDGYMNPEHPQTAEYLTDICEEITRRYDIDGIHLDYIRYPETWRGKVNLSQGRRNITSIVTHIYNKVKSMKPWVKVSCSPVGKYDNLTRYDSYGWNANTKVMQDAQGWLRDGVMDMLMPMMYFRGNQFFPFAIDWQECNYGRIVAPGLGIYFMSPREKDWNLDVVTREMEFLRSQGMGYCFFRSKFFTDNVKGIYDYTRNDFNRSLSLVPAMTWQSNRQPQAPSRLQLNSVTGELSWSHACDKKSDQYYTYNIYASSEGTVDVSDARNLVAVRYMKNSIKVMPGLTYAVTAMDRYGNESHAVMVGEPSAKHDYDVKLLTVNGGYVKLHLMSEIDADCISFETVQGSIVAVKTQKAGKVYVGDLPRGLYVVRGVNNKGIAHRLGVLKR